MKKSLAFLSAVVLLTACNRNEDYTPKGDYENGFFILNEGYFGQNNGSLDYVSYGFSNTEEKVYQKVNSEALGDTPQSSYRNGDDLYIVVNNSNKLVKVNRYTMKKQAEVTTGLKNPRYMTVVNGKLYITNWGEGLDNTDDYILVLDAATLKEIAKIPVDYGVEKIFSFQNKIYALLQGGWSKNNKLAVINPSSNVVEKYYTIGYNPNGYLVEDNKVLITCKGDGFYDASANWAYTSTVDGSIWTLTASGVEKTYDWAQTSDKKESIQEIVKVNQSYFFLVDGKLHKAAVGSDLTKSTQVSETSFYRLSKLDEVFAVGLDGRNAKALFFNEAGLQKTISTGIYPNSVVE
ncbi:YncE family protein [Riemerella anatipestifer]|uniref:Type IV secretion system putative lipoprotein virB7 n=3 Tax=Riemerella anatipestifer TaxID=34085 RepID=A0AAP3EWD3_RIEAN|nr:DUF5074 domain-containing protein [Riemerella anatipestifer]AZZ58022.1 hypothetical protein AWB57_02625 [Riemerella anatipestifer]MBT0572542.1 lipoprotein [Riemerella anatipestifer]MCQ4156115.1 lipoprotein [Riemerella anatipestifer]MCQ4181993.1 lipoprotein [Riemerella anatipestifer]MCU7541497.1 lipoprotein [Riemerella anatipestifer]